MGDTRTIKVDVRVITATNRSLPELVRAGRLREDLYYRLRVVELHLPALRERHTDIPLLVDHFIEQFNRQFRRRVVGVSDMAQNALMAHAWPGNIRELRHALEHGFIMSRGDFIDVDALPPEVRTAGGGELGAGGEGLGRLAPDLAPSDIPPDIPEECANLESAVGSRHVANKATREGSADPARRHAAGQGAGTREGGGRQRLTRERLEAALLRTGGNKALAARLLGVSRQTVYRKLEEYELAADFGAEEAEQA